MYSKSVNPLDLLQKSTIHILFNANSIDLKTYTPLSLLSTLKQSICQALECSLNRTKMEGFFCTEVNGAILFNTLVLGSVKSFLANMCTLEL